MTSVPVPPPATGAHAHTKRAIIDAAVRRLGADFTASLADIAKEAGVGRTTLHRYFKGRSDLLTAIAATAVAQSTAATQRARLEEGSALDAAGRFCEEHFEMGDMLMLVLEQPQLNALTMMDWQQEISERGLLELIARGQTEGTIDSGFPPEWARQMIWSFIYAGLHYEPADGTSRYGALSLCLRSLRRTLEPRK